MADELKEVNTVEYDSIKTVNTIAIADMNELNTIPPCLVEGTPMILADGTEIPIETVKPGTELRTYNVEKGEADKAEVTWVQEPREVESYLEIEAGDGTVLKITEEHPIFIMSDNKNGEFIEAGKVKVGQKFLNKDNDLVPIVKIQEIKKKVKVYNATVDKFHNYFGAGMLCHNSV